VRKVAQKTNDDSVVRVYVDLYFSTFENLVYLGRPVPVHGTSTHRHITSIHFIEICLLPVDHSSCCRSSYHSSLSVQYGTKPVDLQSAVV
jgi:hypothetical protein